MMVVFVPSATPWRDAVLRKLKGCQAVHYSRDEEMMVSGSSRVADGILFPEISSCDCVQALEGAGEVVAARDSVLFPEISFHDL